MFERGLLADHQETGRRVRRILIGIVIAIVIGIAGLLGYAYVPGPTGRLGLIALPLGFGVALGIGLQGANANYWSDVALIAYFVQPPGVKHGAESAVTPADYEVYITLGRAQTQDWFSKTGSGRFVRALLPPASEESTRVLIRNAVTGT